MAASDSKGAVASEDQRRVFNGLWDSSARKFQSLWEDTSAQSETGEMRGHNSKIVDKVTHNAGVNKKVTSIFSYVALAQGNTVTKHGYIKTIAEGVSE